MNKIITNIRFNFKRLRSNLLALIVGILILPTVVICYLEFSSVNSLGKIAVINANEKMVEYLNKNNIYFETMKKRPGLEAIMMGEYIGYVEYNNDAINYGSYCGAENEKKIEMIAYQKPIIDDNTQSLFISIFPIILVIMFLQAVLNMKLYIEDRENGMINRLRISNLGKNTYLMSQIIYNCLFMCIPTIITLFVGKYLLKLSYGLEIYQIIAAVAVTSLVSASMALALCSIVKKNESAIMVGNVIAVISTLLSGVFGLNPNIVFISKIMPQYILMEWVRTFKNNGMVPVLVYCKIMIMIFILLVTSVIINKNIYWKN